MAPELDDGMVKQTFGEFIELIEKSNKDRFDSIDQKQDRLFLAFETFKTEEFKNFKEDYIKNKNRLYGIAIGVPTLISIVALIIRLRQ